MQFDSLYYKNIKYKRTIKKKFAQFTLWPIGN